MATSLTQFEKLQLGIEVVGTKGTIVPATVQIVGNHNMLEEMDIYRDNYPRGFRSNVGGLGSIMRKAISLDVQTELSAEDILWPLMTGVLGSVAASTSDTSAKTYVFTPELATAVATIQSATAEFVRGDGTTNHYTGQSGYCMTESFKIDWVYNQVAKLGWKMFGRARQSGAPTGSLAPYTTREALVSNGFGLYWDTSWANLGNTQVTGIIRSASFECKTGFAPDYTLDARADRDMVSHKVGVIGATLNVVVEFDAAGATKFGLWRANTPLNWIRLKNTGSLAGAATVLRTVQIDGCYRFVGQPTFSADGDQVLMTANLESVYDTTGTKTLEFTAINKLATISAAG